MDAIIHVLRCFEDADVTHVEGSVDPMRDAETVETELMLADLESLEKRLLAAQKKARGGDKESVAQVALMEPIVAALQAGRPARTAIPPGEEEAVRRLQLLTVEAGAVRVQRRGGLGRHRQRAFRARGRGAGAGGGRAHAWSCPPRSRPRWRSLPEADRAEFLEGLGLHDSGLDRVIRAGYDLLGLITYFTVGPKETRAWTIVQGTKAPQAAGGDPQRFRARLHCLRNHRL